MARAHPQSYDPWINGVNSWCIWELQRDLLQWVPRHIQVETSPFHANWMELEGWNLSSFLVPIVNPVGEPCVNPVKSLGFPLSTLWEKLFLLCAFVGVSKEEGRTAKRDGTTTTVHIGETAQHVHSHTMSHSMTSTLTFPPRVGAQMLCFALLLSPSFPLHRSPSMMPLQITLHPHT